MSNQNISKTKLFISNGVKIQPGPDEDSNWVGNCPFCGKQSRFHVNPFKGVWDCKVCGESGNEISFLTKISEKFVNDISRADRKRLSKHRSIPSGILSKFEIGYNELLDCYSIPIRGESGAVKDVRRYDLKTKKLKSTAGCKLQLWGADRLKEAKSGSRVWLCEGEWDGMAMDWLLREAEVIGDVVVSVPGANTFKEEWHKLFKGMDVVVPYDNDQAGDKGSLKVYKKIKKVAASLSFVHWPDSKDNGYDLRDYIVAAFESDVDPDDIIEDLIDLVEGTPKQIDQLKASGEEIDDEDNAKDLPPLVDITFDEVADIFADTVFMTDELKLILKLMLAVALSNDVKSDPVWLYIVGPPGSGKTMLLSAFQGSNRCLFRSTLTPASLVSGWKSENGADPSLIPMLNNKTLIAKDFTEILDMPSIAQDEIFSTLRGAFDGHVQKSFGNGVNREYHDCHFSILAGVTHAIHGHKKAHLGERFLRVEMKKMSDSYMDKVLETAMNSIGEEKKIETILQHAVASFLQLEVDKAPKLTNEIRKQMSSLVKLIAIIRSQVERDIRSGEVSYRPQAELGTRLAKQLTKIGSMIAFIDGKPEIDQEVYEVCCRIAFDTVGGYTLDVIEALMKNGGQGTKIEIADLVQTTKSTLHRRFDDLEVIGAIYKDGEGAGLGVGRPAASYRVSEQVAKLWRESKGELWQAQNLQASTKTQSKLSKRKLAQRREKALIRSKSKSQIQEKPISRRQRKKLAQSKR